MQHEIGIKLSASGGAQVKSTLQQFNADMSALGSRVDTVRTAIGGLGPVLAGTLSVGALTAWVKSSIEAMDALNDAADATGATIEELSKLEVIALRNGDSLDTVTTAMIKLNKELASTDGKNGASLALQELGLEAEKLRRLSPAEAWREVAIALNGVEAGGAKARLQYELLGKSTRELAANLKDVAESGDVAATITTQQAQEAEKFAKAMSLLSTNISLAARSLVSEMIPALTDTLDKFNRFQAGGTISGFWTLLKTQFAEGQIQAQREELERLMDVLAGNKLPENESYWVAQIKEARQELDRLTGAASAARGELNAALGISNAGGGRGFVNPETVKRQVRDMQDLTAAQKAAEAAAKASAEAMKKAEKLRADSIAYATRITDDAVKASNAYADSLQNAAESIETENQRLRDQYIELTAGKEALGAVVALRLEERAVALERAADATGWEAEAEQLRTQARLLREQIALRQGITEATASQEAQRANTQAAERAVTDWDRAADQIGQSLSDALMDGGKSAAEYIRGVFRALVLRPVIQGVVQLGVNGAMSLVANAAGAGTAGTNWVNAGSSAVSLGTGSNTFAGYAAAAGNYGAVYSGSAYGTGFGTQQSAMLASQEAGMVSSAGGSSAAAYAGWAALAAVIYAKGMADWEAGFRRDEARNTGTIAGRVTSDTSDLLTSLGVSQKIADFFGATAVAATIGRAAPTITGSGIQGSFGGGQFAGQQYADIYEKGGFLRSGNAYQSLTALPEDLARFLDEAAAGVMTKAEEFGAALGLPVAALAGVTTDIKLNLGDSLGNNEEDITNALAAYGDALVAGWTDALKPVAVYGETTLQTIERVGQAIKGTNDVLALLDVGMLEASVSGGQAAAALAAAFGSLDNLTQASAAYYQNYFSEAERATKATEQLTAALAGVGLAMPASREQFRGLVEGLDLATESGRDQFVVLMSLQQAFAELTPATVDATTAISDAADVLRERQALELDLLRLQGDTAGIRALERAALDSTNRALYDQIKALEDTQTAAQQAAALAADAAAAATQRLQAMADETSALEVQLLELQGNTAELRARERAALLSDEARAIYDQINALKDSQGQWRDAGSSAVRAASTASSAWASTWQGMADEIKRLRGGETIGGNALLAEFATATAQARAGDVQAGGRLAGLARGLSEEGRNASATRVEFDVLNAKLAASLERTLQETGAPAELLAGLRADAKAAHAEDMAAAAQTLTLLRRVSVVLTQFDAEGMPGVRTE